MVVDPVQTGVMLVKKAGEQELSVHVSHSLTTTFSSSLTDLV